MSCTPTPARVLSLCLLALLATEPRVSEAGSLVVELDERTRTKPE